MPEDRNDAVLDVARLEAVRRTGLLDSPAQESFDGLTALASRLLHAPMAFMTLVDEERSFWLSACGLGGGEAGDQDGPPRQNTVQESFCQYVVADRSPLIVGDALHHPRTAGNPSVELMGVRAWAGYPVVDGEGHTLGSFCVMDTVERDWTSEDVEVLAALAQAASAQVQLLSAVAEQQAARVAVDAARDAERLAIAETARRVARLAEALQRSLLTQPSPRADLEVAVRYLPAATEAQVGGDWHDAFTSTAGHTYLCVGDVAGHDRMAAAAMAQVRNLLRGMAIDSEDQPAQLLARLDRGLAALELDSLATAVLVRVDAPAAGSERVLRWSSAGHLPGLLRTADGAVQVLDGLGDLLLGLDAGSPRGEQEVVLPPGATLVLCTDGLVERRGEDLTDGIDRLAAALARHGHQEPERVCDLLLADLLPEGSSDDDVALLVLRPRD